MKCMLQISAYFVGLAAPNSEEAIKFVDKVGGFEWLIKKYEMDGSAAMKLDLSLETPIIVVPGSSSSKELILAYLHRFIHFDSIIFT